MTPLAPTGWIHWPLVALAGLVAGFVNAIAGGGSLLSFPALIAAGLPPLVANVTNTVALSGGYLGASVAQRHELRGQGRRLALLLPVSALGGLAGGLLLLAGDVRLFERLVPWLILSGGLLLGLQQPLASWLRRRSTGAGTPDGAGSERQGELRAAVLVFVAALYGGYFGAGLSVIVLAALAITLEESLRRLNGLKQAIALVTNLLAAVLFMLAVPLHWPSVAVLAGASLAGGALGGRLASRIAPERLRAVVVTLSFLVAAAYFRR